MRGRVALVTGANRGSGKAIVEALLTRGAAKVYAGARNPERLAAVVAASGGRVVPLRLDVTDGGQVQAAAILDGLEAGEEDILPDPYAVDDGAVDADASVPSPEGPEFVRALGAFAS